MMEDRAVTVGRWKYAENLFHPLPRQKLLAVLDGDKSASSDRMLVGLVETHCQLGSKILPIAKRQKERVLHDRLTHLQPRDLHFVSVVLVYLAVSVAVVDVSTGPFLKVRCIIENGNRL